MFRTVIVNTGEKITVRDGWMVVSAGEEEHRVPLEDIYSVVIDNQQTVISVPSVSALTEAGVHILVCNDKHLPQSVIYPLNMHYRPLNVIRKQLEMPREFKDELWKYIIRSKISNQGRVLEMRHVHRDKSDRMYTFAGEVEPGDPGNREGIAAKWFFHALYGAEFIRFSDDAVNAALNYGYAIIRSALGKTLSGYGYNCVLGVHHVSESNPFNLADDLMEPIRPIVDLWVDMNREDLVAELTRENRRELGNLLNHLVQFDRKKMHLRYAIDKYVSSLTTAIERNKPSLIKIPVIIENDPFFEDEGDE